MEYLGVLIFFLCLYRVCGNFFQDMYLLLAGFSGGVFGFSVEKSNILNLEPLGPRMFVLALDVILATRVEHTTR